MLTDRYSATAHMFHGMNDAERRYVTAGGAGAVVFIQALLFLVKIFLPHKFDIFSGYRSGQYCWLAD